MDKYEQTDGQTKRITINDVRRAIEQLGGDPGKTNAMAVRKVLGSGGFNTIQKHLETLRTERSCTDTTEFPETAPEAPKNLMNGVWSAAWAEASKRHGKELGNALAKADDLERRLQASLHDMDDLSETLDRLQTERYEAIERAETAERALEIERQVITAQKITLDELMEQVKLMIRSSN